MANKAYRRQSWRKERIKVTSAEHKYMRIYEYSAKRRYLPFTVTLIEFIDIAKQNCSYCNDTPTNRILFEDKYYYFSGIDRVNSELGYVPGNIVSCCLSCNVRKGTRTLTEFMEREHARKILHTERSCTVLED